MILVVDSNVLVSALIRDSKTREIILQSGIRFVHPFVGIKNLEKYKEEFIDKSGLTKEEYSLVYELIFDKIELVEKDIFMKNLVFAKEIMGDVDVEDVPFIALALSVHNDGIWSDDKHFKKQDIVNVFTTQELIDFLSIA